MRPIGQLVIPSGCEAPKVSAVVVDAVNLESSVEIRCEYEVPSVRGPAGRFVPCVAFGEFYDLFGAEVKDIQVEYLINPGDVGDVISLR